MARGQIVPWEAAGAPVRPVSSLELRLLIELADQRTRVALLELQARRAAENGATPTARN